MAAPERAIIEDIINRSLRPSAATWLKHIGILLVTFLTTTVAGVLYPFGLIPILFCGSSAKEKVIKHA